MLTRERVTLADPLCYPSNRLGIRHHLYSELQQFIAVSKGDSVRRHDPGAPFDPTTSARLGRTTWASLSPLRLPAPRARGVNMGPGAGRSATKRWAPGTGALRAGVLAEVSQSIMSGFSPSPHGVDKFKASQTT